MSPLESESRMAAQLALLSTVELMPYFLKKPFSWAMTIGEQSVSAMMPKFMSGMLRRLRCVRRALQIERQPAEQRRHAGERRRL